MRFAVSGRLLRGTVHETGGFGLVYLEAAAAGRPVVAGTAGGTGSALRGRYPGDGRPKVSPSQAPMA